MASRTTHLFCKGAIRLLIEGHPLLPLVPVAADLDISRTGLPRKGCRRRHRCCLLSLSLSLSLSLGGRQWVDGSEGESVRWWVVAEKLSRIDPGPRSHTHGFLEFLLGISDTDQERHVVRKIEAFSLSLSGKKLQEPKSNTKIAR